MKAQTSRVEIAMLQMPSMMQQIRYISPRTFVHCLHALFVNTKVLATNVLSLHRYMADYTDPQDDTPVLLSALQLELVEQAVALQRRIAQPLQPQEWIYYADMWRVADVRDIPTSLAHLQHATDLLAGLYESMLPTAAALPDQAISFYLLAAHLVALNEYCLALERVNRTMTTPTLEYFSIRKLLED